MVLVASDILKASNDRDKFVFAPGEGTDIITDFYKDNNLISLSGGLTFRQLSFCCHNIIVTTTDEILATLTAANFTIV
ncbi:hypothetical protein [Nostoc sp. DedQUE07]|uniref:hypothetical protein n=1 Tax=Nostoc sp. DedQUE07 TaxID=3075392 RepID=UPI002AD9A5B2|nr:hypothetical protein [Nostoc sp. DedQUE07]